MSEKAITIRNLSKRYTIGKKKDGSLRGMLQGLFSAGGKGETFWALKNVHLEVEQGDVVGIIGKNGAGKSTLLKLLSQITYPTTGRIEMNGRVASLLEVGTGFHPELTGRENIFLNGTILGMTRNEVKKKLDEIVAFSGIEKFIDTPVKRYSSGMYVRLAFAVAAHLEPEILIIDEVLAVGDMEFQKKCIGKMRDVAGQGRTVLFVSHNLGSIRQLCNKGVLLDRGQIQMIGSIDATIKAYQELTSIQTEYENPDSDKDYFIRNARINDSSNQFYSKDSINFTFNIGHNHPINSNLKLLVRVMDEIEQVITSSETNLSDGKVKYELSFPASTFAKGRFKLNCIVYHPAVAQYDKVDDCCNFEVLDTIEDFAHLDTFDIGKVYVNQVWK